MAKTTKKEASTGAKSTAGEDKIQNPPVSETTETKEEDVIDKAEDPALQDKQTDKGAETEKQDSANNDTGDKKEPDRTTCLKKMIETSYQPYYKDNKVWHVTSDDSVFLCSDRQHAAGHQRVLNTRSGNVEEFLTLKTE